MKKSQKTSIIMIVICIVLIAIIFLIFSNIDKMLGFENSETSDRKNSYTDEQLNTAFEEKGKYSVSIVNPEYEQLTKNEAIGIDNTIDFILDCLNNKKSLELYEKLLESYRVIKFKTVDEFNSYLGTEFPNTDYECVSYSLEALNTFIKIRSISNSEEIHTIKLYGEDFSDFSQTSIAFETFNYAERAGGLFYLDDAIVRIKNLVFYADKNSVYMEIKNSSNKVLKIDFYESEVIKQLSDIERKTISKSSSYVEIPAKQTGYVEVFFNNSSIFRMKPDKCSFKLKVNGISKKMDIWFLYEDPSI